jgi:Rieske Fe-S protein
MAEHEASRRDFIKVTTGIVGGLIGAAVGLPAVSYLLAPALRESGKEAWIPIGRLEDMQVGKPYAFSFTRVQVNGWERTATSHGGFALRKSDDPTDILILNSQCTHLACTVNWNEQAGAYLCPCHDAKFDAEGRVLDGPPPRPLRRFEEFRVTDEGSLEIFYSATKAEEG